MQWYYWLLSFFVLWALLAYVFRNIDCWAAGWNRRR